MEQEYVRAFEPLSAVVGTEVATRHFDWTHPRRHDRGQRGRRPPGRGAGRRAPSGPRASPTSTTSSSRSTGTRSPTAPTTSPTSSSSAASSQSRDTLTFRADSSVSRIRAGATFELNGHPVVGLNAGYVVVNARPPRRHPHGAGVGGRRDALALRQPLHRRARRGALPAAPRPALGRGSTASRRRS